MRRELFLAVALAILALSLGDTKVLQNIKINGDNSYREETFSLNNENTAEEELTIKGNHMQSFYPANDPDHVYRVETIYVADKNGYRVKYTIVREEQLTITVQLNPITLKSSAG